MPDVINPTPLSTDRLSVLRDQLRHVYARVWRLPRMHRTYGALSVAETFRRIYRTKAWGDNGEAFCSGLGSRGPVAQLYCASVAQFVQDHRIQSVVDLGCGDFTVGRQIVEASGDIRYTGIDVVPEMIEHHQKTNSDPRVSFRCADISRDPLPKADLCLIRQVLQHLSNEEIARVLANLGSFSKILISEEVPNHPGPVNRDKPHGPDVRGYFGSGVYVEEPPFSMKTVELWKFELTPYSVLRTVLRDQTATQ